MLTRLLIAWLATCAVGCVTTGYTGASRELAPQTLRAERGWIAVHDVPLLKQQAQYDCGPTALDMVLRYWQRDRPGTSAQVRDTDLRSSAGELRDHARKLGFLSFVMEGKFEDILHELSHGRPVIVGTAKPTTDKTVAHYEVVVGVHPQSRRIATLDPSLGHRQHTLKGFLQEWLPTGQVLLVVLPPESPAEPRAQVHPDAPHSAALR